MPEVDFDGEFDHEADFSFTAKVQVKPTPELGRVQRPRGAQARASPSTDGQVEAQLALLQERFASLKPVEDRAGARRRLRAHRFRGHVGGRAHRGRPGERLHGAGRPRHAHPRVRGEPRSASRIGDEKQFDVTFPADYGAEELAGKPATFTVKVKEIKEKIVPELNDAFAKDVSEFETLDELRADVRQRLETGQQAQVEREYRTRVDRRGRRQRDRQRAAGHGRSPGAQPLPRPRVDGGRAGHDHGDLPRRSAEDPRRGRATSCGRAPSTW